MQEPKAPLLGIPANNELSVIRDPFKTEHVVSINIHGQVSPGNRIRWNAQISFDAGLTSGIQNTGSCPDFEEVLQKLRQILDEVQQK
jgi:hypothetical protein